MAGRKIHPFVMAMSYGATFISTSAIVGFGGAAGVFGMGLLWLTFLNIFVGIFIAFVFFGARTRAMGHHLDAHTFPELLGRRYDSKFIQVFSGLVIILFMPLYTGVVLMGAAKAVEVRTGTPYAAALLFFSAIVALYVIMGGLKGVMYTDALQGTIMFVAMIVILLLTYSKLGGVVEAHQRLTDLASHLPEKLVKGGPPGMDGHAEVRQSPMVDAGVDHCDGRWHWRVGAAAACSTLYDGAQLARTQPRRVGGRNLHPDDDGGGLRCRLALQCALLR